MSLETATPLLRDSSNRRLMDTLIYPGRPCAAYFARPATRLMVVATMMAPKR